MRTSFVLALPLLAGCASAAERAAEPAPERRPVITRIASTDRPRTVIGDSAKVAGMRIEMMEDAPCQTGDRMPTAGLDPGQLAPMPSAQPLRELPYIPNLCPVTAAPEYKPSVPAVLQRPPKHVREPGEQP